MSFLLPVLFFALLFPWYGETEGREKGLYIFLSVAAMLLGAVAAFVAENDHVGASLSGMISIFMR